VLRSIAGGRDPPVRGNNPAKSRGIPGAPSNDRAQIPQGRTRSLGQDAASGQTTEPPTPRTSRSGRGKGLPDRWIVRVRGNVTRALPRSSDATTACPHAVEHNAVKHAACAHWRIVRAIVTIDRSHLQHRKDALPRQGRGKRRSIPTLPGLPDQRTSKRDRIRVGCPDPAGCCPACAEGTPKRKRGARCSSVAVPMASRRISSGRRYEASETQPCATTHGREARFGERLAHPHCRGRRTLEAGRTLKRR
jgi:hypothetical protein